MLSWLAKDWIFSSFINVYWSFCLSRSEFEWKSYFLNILSAPRKPVYIWLNRGGCTLQERQSRVFLFPRVWRNKNLWFYSFGVVSSIWYCLLYLWDLFLWFSFKADVISKSFLMYYDCFCFLCFRCQYFFWKSGSLNLMYSWLYPPYQVYTYPSR